MEVFNTFSLFSTKFLSFKLFLTLISFNLILSSLNNGPIYVNAEVEEDSCTWLQDGTKICDEPENSHNVWKAPSEDEREETQKELEEKVKGIASTELNELELELFVIFVGQLDNWDPSEGLKKISEEVVVYAIFNGFSVIDSSDDGFLEYDEIESVFQKRHVDDNLSKVQEILREFPDEKISIFQYLNIFEKFDDGKETTSVLAPFARLHYMPPNVAKRIMQGSVQMFLDADKNHDGKLSMDEFEFGMKKAQEKRKNMGDQNANVPSDQLAALFSLMDTDKNDYLTYIEFQGTLPDKPKTLEESMEAVFDKADIDRDNALSEVEFEAYLKIRNNEDNSKGVPTGQEVADLFKQLDVNEDGSVSKDEIRTMFAAVKKAQEQRIGEVFNSFDKDADGSLCLDELEDIVKGMEKNSGQKVDAAVFLTMLDRDMDKKVSLEEMTEMLTRMLK